MPLVTGFIKIEVQRADGTWVDVTTDILALGFTGRRLTNTNPGTGGGPFVATNYYLSNVGFDVAPAAGTNPACADPSPNAVIRLQRVREDHNPLNAATCGVSATNRQSPYDVVPNALFDPREGNLRDNNSVTATVMPLGGVMHYVELDMRNLTRWLNGDIGAGGFGPQAEFSDNGYAIYFSDRRTNARVGGLETGEYGFEDIVNPAAVTTMPDGVLDTGEDVNGIDRDGDASNLDVYGQVPNAGVLAALRAGAPVSGATRPWTTASAREARSNPQLFFRRALKLVNAAGTTADAAVSPFTILPVGRGVTVVSENPVLRARQLQHGRCSGPPSARRRPTIARAP